jgi:hypothetical protein
MSNIWWLEGSAPDECDTYHNATPAQFMECQISNGREGWLLMNVMSSTVHGMWNNWQWERRLLMNDALGYATGEGCLLYLRVKLK